MFCACLQSDCLAVRRSPGDGNDWRVDRNGHSMNWQSGMTPLGYRLAHVGSAGPSR